MRVCLFDQTTSNKNYIYRIEYVRRSIRIRPNFFLENFISRIIVFTWSYVQSLLCTLFFFHIILIFFYVLFPFEISIHISVIKIFAWTLEGFTNIFLKLIDICKIAKCILQWTEEVVIRGCQIRTLRDRLFFLILLIIRIWHPLITTFSVHWRIYFVDFPHDDEPKKSVRKAFKSQSKNYRADMYRYLIHR